MLRLCICIAAVFSVSVCAAAAEPKNDAVVEKGPRVDKKVCRKEVATGSIMRRRVCHTKAEWDAIENQGKTSLDHQRTMERPTDGA